MIIVIKHISVEGPGTLGKFLENAGRQFNTVELDTGDKLPDDLSKIEAVISLGGPMNVYEEDEHPFLKDEDIFLKKAIEREIPILGICLGAQLLAKAAGAEVKKAPEKEIGWYRLRLTDEGENDRLFKGIGKEFSVFQWHEDTFQIPKGASLLATSNTCKNQAFRLGKNAYGLQFHIEVDDKMIENWSNEYLKKEEKMLIDYYKIKGKFNTSASRIYNNFNEHILDTKRQV